MAPTEFLRRLAALIPWPGTHLIDVLRCPACGGRRRIVSFLTESDVVRRILTHLGLPTDAPAVAPARVMADLGPVVELFDDVERCEFFPWGRVSRHTLPVRRMIDSCTQRPPPPVSLKAPSALRSRGGAGSDSEHVVWGGR